MDHGASAPPSPPPAPPQRQQTGAGWQPDETDESPRAVAWRARRAMRIAIQVRGVIGDPPNGAIDGDEGTGLWKLLTQVKTTLASVRAEIAAERAERDKRSGIAGRIGWRIVDTVIPLVVGAFILWASGHLR